MGWDPGEENWCRMIEMNLDDACMVSLNEPEKALTPSRFATAHGREGWAVRMPEPLPIAITTE